MAIYKKKIVILSSLKVLNKSKYNFCWKKVKQHGFWKDFVDRIMIHCIFQFSLCDKQIKYFVYFLNFDKIYYSKIDYSMYKN